MTGEVVIGTGDAFPLKQAPPDALSGRNTSTEWRRILFDALIGTGPLHNGWSITREGVIPRRLPVMVGVVPQFRDLLVKPRTSPGQGVLIDPGIFAVYRGKSIGSVHEGIYLGALLDAAADLPLAAAEGAQNRVDTVFVRLVDKNIAADSASSLPHGPSFGYVLGTPTAGALDFAGVAGAAGAPPVVPEGCLPLWDIPRMAGVNTITQAVVDAGRDRRKSTGVRGGSRVLMPGDSLTEAGNVPGETTIVPPATGRAQTVVRVWDGTAWRLASPFTLTSTPGTVPGSSQAVPSTLATITVPDIGCPYRVKVHSTTRVRMQGINAYVQQVTRVDTVAGPLVRMGDCYKPTMDSDGVEYPMFGGSHGVYPHPGAAALTGSHAFQWRMESPAGGSTAVWFDPVPGVDGSPGAQQYSVEVVPA